MDMNVERMLKERHNMDPIMDIKPQFTQMFINNEWCNSDDGKTFETRNPATTDVICRVQEGNKTDIDRAVTAAKEAFKLESEWRRMDASQRGVILMRLADRLERECRWMASLECLDTGKPFLNAVDDVCFAARCLRYYGGWTDKVTGTTPPVDGDFFTYTRMEPVGVCGAILPGNFPLMQLCWKVGQALAAGCTIVVKPNKETPLTALHFASWLKECGLPRGVVNIVPGHSTTAGVALSRHMDVRKISFTGNQEFGRLVERNASETNLKRVTLDLGGQTPNIIFADTNIDYAVEESHHALFTCKGHAGGATGTRCFVQAEIYDEFVKRATARAAKVTVGNPFDKRNENGPMINEEQHKKCLDLIETTKREGAKLMCGGKPMGDRGYYIQPTVFADVKDNMRITKEECYGPVWLISRFNNIDEGNFPLMQLCWKVGQALAAGCTIVVKPNKETPLTALHFASWLKECGLPRGVVNIVPGHSTTAGVALSRHMDVRKISFTGNQEFGRLVERNASETNLKRVTLDLGGQTPNIIFADTNIDYAVEESHHALFTCKGHAGGATGTRCFVQAEIYDEFVKRATARAAKVTVGNPFDKRNENGPMINEEQHKKCLDLIETTKREGAKLMCGGKPMGDRGYYIQPTVFADVKDSMRITKEECYGPVWLISKFNTIDEVINRTNDETRHGLAAACFTTSLDTALYCANRIRSGTVWVNCYNAVTPQAPFGGCKESGLGREQAEEGIREYCEIKTVTMKVLQKTS